MSIRDQLFAFISQPIEDISKQLTAIKAKVIVVRQDTQSTHDPQSTQSDSQSIQQSDQQSTQSEKTYMIKFGEESQFLAFEPFQLYLKGIIFRQGKILAVPYMTPIDVFRLPAESQETIKNIIPDHFIITKIGTLLKLAFYDNKWNLSTNGGSDAFEVTNTRLEMESFGEYFTRFAYIDESACSLNGYSLNKECTYIFILTDANIGSCNLYHSTTINNNTLVETSDYIGVTQFDKLECGAHGLQMFDHLNVNYTSIVNTAEGYTHRYLYSAQIDNILIDYARGLVLTGFNYAPYSEKIMGYVNQLNDLIVYIRLNYFKMNRYHDKINVGKITFQIIRRIHGKYLTVLRPNKLVVNDKFIAHFLSTECTTREIFCLLSESKMINK